MQSAIGVDLSGARISAAVADRAGRVLAKWQTESRPEDSPEAGLERLLPQVKYVVSQAGLDPRAAQALDSVG